MEQVRPSILAAGSKIPVAGHVLDIGRELLLDPVGRVVELRPQAYQVLRHLALNSGRLVSKDELLGAVWPNLVVTDDSLVQAIGDVRRALGAAGPEAVKTLPRRGYMLIDTAATCLADPPPPTSVSDAPASPGKV